MLWRHPYQFSAMARLSILWYEQMGMLAHFHLSFCWCIAIRVCVERVSYAGVVVIRNIVRI